MLAVHWSPVKNTGHILKNGIKKSKRGLFCFPLTGLPAVDKEWARFFRNSSEVGRKTQHNGFVFRITQEDLPATFTPWWVDGFAWAEGDIERLIINDINKLEEEFREVILWALGQPFLEHKLNGRYPDPQPFPKTKTKAELESAIDYFENKDNIQVANSKIDSGIVTHAELRNDLDFMKYAFTDYQIVLSNSIAPNRIMKIISDRNEYGKILHKNKKNNLWKKD